MANQQVPSSSASNKSTTSSLLADSTWHHQHQLDQHFKFDKLSHLIDQLQLLSQQFQGLLQIQARMQQQFQQQLDLQHQQFLQQQASKQTYQQLLELSAMTTIANSKNSNNNNIISDNSVKNGQQNHRSSNHQQLHNNNHHQQSGNRQQQQHHHHKQQKQSNSNGSKQYSNNKGGSSVDSSKNKDRDNHGKKSSSSSSTCGGGGGGVGNIVGLSSTGPSDHQIKDSSEPPVQHVPRDMIATCVRYIIDHTNTLNDHHMSSPQSLDQSSSLSNAFHQLDQLERPFSQGPPPLTIDINQNHHHQPTQQQHLVMDPNSCVDNRNYPGTG